LEIKQKNREKLILFWYDDLSVNRGRGKNSQDHDFNVDRPKERQADSAPEMEWSTAAHPTLMLKINCSQTPRHVPYNMGVGEA
jgi:hypothetical protein